MCMSSQGIFTYSGKNYWLLKLKSFPIPNKWLLFSFHTISLSQTQILRNFPFKISISFQIAVQRIWESNFMQEI